MNQPWKDLAGCRELWKWRIKHGHDAQDVAKRIGISPQFYSRIESGHARAPEARRHRIEKITKGAVTVKMWTKEQV